MNWQTIYAVMCWLGVFVELTLFIVLMVGKHYRSFPLFTVYIGFGLLTDVGFLTAARVVPQSSLLSTVYYAMLPLQYFLEFTVLFEIAWKVLRPLQGSVPKMVLWMASGLAVIAALGGILLAWHVDQARGVIDIIQGPLHLTVGLLRMLVFALIAGFAQLLGIGFKTRVLQISTALSFFSACDLMIALGVKHLGNVAAVEPLRSAAYVFEIGFLLWAFSTKEIRRTEFSPQMEQVLVTIAGRAKHARTTFARTQVK